MSINFKTAAAYGYQPVTTTRLLEVYVDYFRKGTSDVEEVFLTTKGTPMKQGYVNRGKDELYCHIINHC